MGYEVVLHPLVCSALRIEEVLLRSIGSVRVGLWAHADVLVTLRQAVAGLFQISALSLLVPVNVRLIVT